jgi:hypothetical protein
MLRFLKRVSQFDRVSSKSRTKILSAVFGLLAFTIFGVSLGHRNISVASDITIENIIKLTNESRNTAGKSLLAENEKLSFAAEAKAGDMIAGNYFSHTSPAGVTPWEWIEGENYNYDFAGENLAMDFHSTEAMEKAWIESPTHRANILNDKYKEMGVAVREGNVNGHETILVVVMFGSGDKNLSSVADTARDEVSGAEGKKKIEGVPMLPPAGKREMAALEQSMVTTPQAGESVSGSEVKISGRSAPGKAIAIFDDQNFVGSAIADSNGWFSMIEKDLSEGRHQLTLESKGTSFRETVEFFVDRSMPDVYFHLYADANNPRKLFLEAGTDKNNCTLQFGRETRKVGQGVKTLFVVDSEKSSVILKVRDIAGNKNFKQVNLANYYTPEKGGGISEKLAAFLSAPGNMYAANSGREAMAENLNLPAQKILAAR